MLARCYVPWHVGLRGTTAQQVWGLSREGAHTCKRRPRGTGHYHVTTLLSRACRQAWPHMPGGCSHHKAHADGVGRYASASAPLAKAVMLSGVHAEPATACCPETNTATHACDVHATSTPQPVATFMSAAQQQRAHDPLLQSKEDDASQAAGRHFCGWCFVPASPAYPPSLNPTPPPPALGHKPFLTHMTWARTTPPCTAHDPHSQRCSRPPAAYKRGFRIPTAPAGTAHPPTADLQHPRQRPVPGHALAQCPTCLHL